MPYHKLSTQKIWEDKVKDEYRSFRRQRNRDAIRSFFQFLICLAGIGFGYWVYMAQDQWVPTVIAQCDAIGMTEKMSVAWTGIQQWWNQF